MDRTQDFSVKLLVMRLDPTPSCSIQAFFIGVAPNIYKLYKYCIVHFILD